MERLNPNFAKSYKVFPYLDLVIVVTLSEHQNEVTVWQRTRKMLSPRSAIILALPSLSSDLTQSKSSLVFSSTSTNVLMPLPSLWGSKVLHHY